MTMHAQHCDNLRRLTFRTHAEYLSYARTNAKMLREIWLWHESLGNRDEPIDLPGICDICECQTTFSTKTSPTPECAHFAFRASWWLGFVCGCGMSSLDRAVFRVFLDGGHREDRIYYVGYHSPSRRWLSERMPNVTSSQYEEGRKSGEIENGIRYEDLTRLSFTDDQFDCIVCTEILEHIADYQASLYEIARTLRPGGRALLTFPWLGGEHFDHLVRAEMMSDGSINHIYPPEYHGDPASGKGILSFRAFGWKILDELREVGFTDASANFIFGPLHGHATLLNPVVVGVR